MAKARDYSGYRLEPARLLSEADDSQAARFNDLAEAARLLGRGSSMNRIRQWLEEPSVRKQPDSRRLRHLLALMDELEIF